MAEKTTVLYIGGWQRSGSTILGNVLNESKGFFHAGEVCYIWTHKPWSNYRCGCGEPFDKCSLWQKVFERSFSGMDSMRDYNGHRPTSRETILATLRKSCFGHVADQAYLAVLEKLYRAIKEVSGCDVIVDSSKYPGHAYLLQQIPSIDLRILHLVRDPRGTAYSWRKIVRRSDLYSDKAQDMPRFSIVKSSLKWFLWNGITELLGRKQAEKYARMRYEDIVDDPADEIRKIIAFAQQETDVGPFFNGREITLGINHTVVGNPSRDRRGTIELKRDDFWRKNMDSRDRYGVNLLTWPLMLRYGYPLISKNV